MYTYEATLQRAVDGDTVDLNIDLGFDVVTRQRFRMLGINAPELHSKDADEKARGRAALEHLQGLLVGPLVAFTRKDAKEKYGRYLVTLTNGAGVNVNEAMVQAGHAKHYDGGKRD